MPPFLLPVTADKSEAELDGKCVCDFVSSVECLQAIRVLFQLTWVPWVLGVVWPEVRQLEIDSPCDLGILVSAFVSQSVR